MSIFNSSSTSFSSIYPEVLSSQSLPGRTDKSKELALPIISAATTIQTVCRGYLARKPLLPSQHYSLYLAECEKIQSSEYETPRATSGLTPVYLPLTMPNVVLKASGRKVAINRFRKMQSVRSVLQLQKSTHLVIPKASLCQDFLVEERLPIGANEYRSMEMYLFYPSLFNEAVREITRLFSKMYIGDLTDPGIRYDNLPFYIVENQGKKEGRIGLIDLENLREKPREDGLETLAKIFPLHLKLIKEEATALGMKFDDKLLKFYAKSGKDFLQSRFNDHLQWLRRKGVSTNTKLQRFRVAPHRTKDLRYLIEKELLKLDQGIPDESNYRGYNVRPQPHFLTGGSEIAVSELAIKIAILMISSIKKGIYKNRRQQLEKVSRQYMAASEMIDFRSPELSREVFFEPVQRLLYESQKTVFSYTALSSVAERIFYVVMQELVRGGELFSFDPRYEAQTHSLCKIRY